MKRLTTISAIFFLATLIIAPVALAGGRGGGGDRCSYGDEDGERGRDGSRRGHRGGKGMSMKRVIKQLDLTEEQREMIMALKDEHKQSVEPYREEMKAQRDELRELWAADNPDRDAILDLEDEMTDTRSKLRVAKTDFKLSVIDQLTPDQRAEMTEILESRESGKERGRRGGRGGRGGERGRCGCDSGDE